MDLHSPRHFFNISRDLKQADLLFVWKSTEQKWIQNHNLKEIKSTAMTQGDAYGRTFTCEQTNCKKLHSETLNYYIQHSHFFPNNVAAKFSL